jgi:hypothetical protein
LTLLAGELLPLVSEMGAAKGAATLVLSESPEWTQPAAIASHPSNATISPPITAEPSGVCAVLRAKAIARHGAKPRSAVSKAPRKSS